MRGKKYDPVDLALAPSPMCFKMLASHKLLHKKKNPSVFTKKFRQQIRATSLHTHEWERQGKDYYVLLKRDNKCQNVAPGSKETENKFHKKVE